MGFFPTWQTRALNSAQTENINIALGNELGHDSRCWQTSLLAWRASSVRGEWLRTRPNAMRVSCGRSAGRSAADILGALLAHQRYNVKKQNPRFIPVSARKIFGFWMPRHTREGGDECALRSNRATSRHQSCLACLRLRKHQRVNKQKRTTKLRNPATAVFGTFGQGMQQEYVRPPPKGYHYRNSRVARQATGPGSRARRLHPGLPQLVRRGGRGGELSPKKKRTVRAFSKYFQRHTQT